jgi:hypothetical protein
VQRFYTGEALDVEAIRSLLKQAGIASSVLNGATAGAVGDLPFSVAQLELWLGHESDEARAREIAEDYFAARDTPGPPPPPWKCPRCGERVGGQFTDCWRCMSPNQEQDPRLDPDAHCAVCAYTLYKLPERRCPECGTKF